MRLTTLDLYSASICPFKWGNEKRKKNESKDVVREAFIELVTYSSGQKQSGYWDIQDIAKVWDEVFWEDKSKADRKNSKVVEESILGLKKLKKLYLSLPDDFIVYPKDKLVTYIDTNIVIESSCDFILNTKDQLAIWIYIDLLSAKVKRSIIPAAEKYVLDNSMVGGVGNKRVYIIPYYIDEDFIKIEKVLAIENNAAIRCFANLLSRNFFYPVPGKHCRVCDIKCWREE